MGVHSLAQIDAARRETSQPAAPAGVSGRIDLFDGIRGHLLIGMVVVHLSFHRASLQTLVYAHHGTVIGLFDAEFFVPLAGILVGMLIRAKLVDPPRLSAFVGKRLRVIYGYYLLSAIPFLLVWLTQLRPDGAIGAARSLIAMLAQVVLMQAGGSYSDILPMYFYCFILLFLLLHLTGINARKWLGLSLLIYLISQINVYRGFFDYSDFLTFNVGAWQFLFIASVALGMHSKTLLAHLARAPAAERYALFVIGAVVTLWLRGGPFWHAPTFTYAESTDMRFQLHPIYLLQIGAALLAFTVLLASRDRIFAWLSWPLRAYFAFPPIATVGKFPIQMFTLHVFLMATYALADPYLSNGQAMMLAVGIIALFIALPSIATATRPHLPEAVRLRRPWHRRGANRPILAGSGDDR